MEIKLNPFCCALQSKSGVVKNWEVTTRQDGLKKLGVVETDGKGFHAFPPSQNGDEISKGVPFATVDEAALALWYLHLLTRYGQ